MEFNKESLWFPSSWSKTYSVYDKEKSAVKSFKSLMENNSSSQDSTDTEDEDEIKIKKLLAKMKHDSD